MPIPKLTARYLTALIAIVGMAVLGTGCGPSDGGEPGGRTTPEGQVDSAPAFAARLVKNGWSQRAATAVVELNQEWFQIQADENPHGLERQLKLLGGLGEHPNLQGFLVDHPETAGLLAASPKPQLIAKTLRFAANNRQYDRIAGLYLQHVAPRDAADLAQALDKNHDLICRLYRQGFLGAEVMFVFERDDAGNVYEQWLRDLFTAKLSAASDDELASFVQLVMLHGPIIRERMRTKPAFRRRFRSELWPKLTRVVAAQQGAFEHYLEEPRVWELLALDNGEQLLLDCGLLPIDLLWGYPQIDHQPYPCELHETIIQILLQRRELAIHSLMKFRGEPQFRRLLQRNLSEQTLSAALAQLHKADNNASEKLGLYERLSDTALAEEVGPPPSGLITWIPLYYTVYEVPKKLLQGREPTGMELFSAAVDPIFLAFDIASLGGTTTGRKVLVVGGKEAAEKVTKDFAEKGIEKVFVTTLRDSGLELAKKRVGKEVAEKMGDKELAGWAVSGMLSQVQQSVRSAIGKATTFDVTRPVQFIFRHSGVGRETWKRWTGMEARLFMRGDAKVFVRLNNLPVAVLGTRGAAFLQRTAEDLTIGMTAESQLGQDAVRGGANMAHSAKDQLQSWRQHVSAWWLLHGSAAEHDLISAAQESTKSEGSPE